MGLYLNDLPNIFMILLFFEMSLKDNKEKLKLKCEIIHQIILKYKWILSRPFQGTNIEARGNRYKKMKRKRNDYVEENKEK